MFYIKGRKIDYMVHSLAYRALQHVHCLHVYVIITLGHFDISLSHCDITNSVRKVTFRKGYPLSR